MSDWTIKTCSCGFGGGDAEHEFDTETEAREFYDYLELSDSSVLDVIGPAGSIVTARDRLMGLYADGLDWSAGSVGYGRPEQ